MPDQPYFVPADLRAATFIGGQLSNTTTYPDAAIDAMRVTVEGALEAACGVTFVPRTFTDQIDGTLGDIMLRPMLQSVTALTLNGVASDMTGIVCYGSGRCYRPGGFPATPGGVQITYTAGYSAPPGRVQRAAMLLTRRFLIDSPISDRATSTVTSEGMTQYLVTAGVRNMVFDTPECNAVVAVYGMQNGVAP